MPELKPTFVIGDSHGHIDRVRALLQVEGIIDDEDRRIRHDCEVIHLGDLGHFGVGGNKQGDLELYAVAPHWFDLILYGNHDAAVMGYTRFGGYEAPGSRVKDLMMQYERDKFLRFAATRHGYLLTHAGLRPEYEKHLSSDVHEAVLQLNSNPDQVEVASYSHYRGAPFRQMGGILWRDAREPLSERWPQVFGHSSADYVRAYKNNSYCIDIGGIDNGRLAGLWLPHQRLVEVDLVESMKDRIRGASNDG